MLQSDCEPGFILHHHAYRDSSVLLEVLTHRHGRQALVARGVRSAKSRLRGLLQPFQPLLLSWQCRAELGTLKQAEAAGPAISLPGQAVFAGFYVNELLLRLVPRGEVDVDCFADYQQVLQGLSQAAIEPALRIFEKRLLEQLGYGLMLDCDIDTGAAIEAGQLYHYIPEHGPTLQMSTAQDGWSISGAALLALATETFTDDESLKQARRLLQQTLRLYLGDKPLKTREVFRAMQKG